MNVKEALNWAINELKDVSEAEKSAKFLLRQVLAPSLCHSREGLPRSKAGGNLDMKAWLLANPDYNLNSEQEKTFRQFIERRKKHEPVWYITGKIEFYGLDLSVNQNVLIPRPETEFLVEEVLKVSKGKKILELGTGSGAISLALANKIKKEGFWTSQNDVKFFASDVSGDALKVAKKNAKKLGMDSRLRGNDGGCGIEFRQGDLLEPWSGEKFDIVVANLPYIPHEDMSSLALDIHHWEPRVALDGGKDGLEIYEKLLSQIPDYLNAGAMMFFEIGIDQGENLKKLVSKYLPNADVKIKKDYGDIDRLAIIKTF